MFRSVLTFGLGVAAAALMNADKHGDHGNVKILSQRDIEEKLGDKATKVTYVEVTLEPGKVGTPHHHPGPVFGYVLEGEYDWAINDAPVKTLKTGETFYEPTGCLHRVSQSASKKNKARVLAVVVHSADAKEIVLPAEDAKK